MSTENKMTQELKAEIVVAVKEYMVKHGLKQSAMSKHSGVGESYLSSILNGKLDTPANGNAVEIRDQYFKMLADSVGMSTEKVYWPWVETREFVQIIDVLNRAKKDGMNATPICETGAGKTYAVDRFCRMNPDHTYRITASSLMTMVDILDELLAMLGLPIEGRQQLKLKAIVNKVVEVKLRGGKPLFIIDESENLKPKHLGVIKALYDGLEGKAAIVLIATPELLDKLSKMERKSTPGIQQFRRRFNAGTRRITSGANRFSKFYDLHNVGTKFRKLLNEICRNYGELHDYLEPVLKYCDQNDRVFCEDEFRVFWNMPE